MVSARSGGDLFDDDAGHRLTRLHTLFVDAVGACALDCGTFSCQCRRGRTRE